MDGQTDRNIDSQRDGQPDRQLAGTEADVQMQTTKRNIFFTFLPNTSFLNNGLSKS